MRDGSSFVSVYTLAFACCASRQSLESVGIETCGVVEAGLGVDVEAAGVETVLALMRQQVLLRLEEE